MTAGLIVKVGIGTLASLGAFVAVAVAEFATRKWPRGGAR